MEGLIILSNPGSTSKKYSVYKEGEELGWFHIEREADGYACSYKIANRFEKKTVDEKQYRASFAFALAELERAGVLHSAQEIFAVSVRSVIPDAAFSQDLLFDAKTLKALEGMRALDPLHIDPVLDELRTVGETVAKRTFVCLISDSTFHRPSVRPVALGLPGGAETIGYHGLACESVLRILADRELSPERLLVCHLGGGSSVSAIWDGKSAYNSMEYSPLGGMTMSSRSGSVDPFLVLRLVGQEGLSYAEAIEFLYRSSGLKALSGVSDDLRRVREEAFKGNPSAKHAIVQFAESAAAYVAHAATYSQGIDALVFTGTIGFRASYMREMICDRLAWMGIRINRERNVDELGTFYEISAFDSPVRIYVAHIDEMKEMHSHTVNLLKGGI